MPKKATSSRKKTAKKTAEKAAAKKPAVRKASSKEKAAPSKTPKVVTKVKQKTTTKKTARKSALSSAAAAAAAVAAVHSINTAPEPEQIEILWTDAKRRRVKTGLTRKNMNTFKTSLMKKRREIIGDVRSLESSNTSSGNLSHMPLHMADVGSDNYDQEFTLGLVESERKLLGEINGALERAGNGTYGVCLASGKPIPPERLEIKPWARYTIEVVRKHERQGIAS